MVGKAPQARKIRTSMCPVIYVIHSAPVGTSYVKFTSKFTSKFTRDRVFMSIYEHENENIGTEVLYGQTFGYYLISEIFRQRMRKKLKVTNFTLERL